MVKELTYPSSGSVSYINMHSRVSWGAVYGGGVVTLACLVCLAMLGAGIGFISAPAADTGAGLAKGLGAGAAAWWFITAVVSFYAGGWFAGRMNGIGRVSESVIHGVLMWGVTTLALLFMVTSAVGGLLGGLTGGIGKAIGGAGQAAAVGAARDGGADGGAGIEGFSERLSEAREKIAGEARELRREFGDEARRAQAEARARAPQAREKAQKASTAFGAAGLFGFVTMMIELLAAAFGARAGTRILRPAVQVEAYRRETSGV